jgi:phosphatidylinositol kinase/protein kinase (PI-3  family)
MYPARGLFRVGYVLVVCPPRYFVVRCIQIVLIGSDGREYPFLAKPKDDLRKDSRMMEVAGLLNRLVLKDPEARRRNLYIRR